MGIRNWKLKLNYTNNSFGKEKGEKIAGNIILKVKLGGRVLGICFGTIWLERTVKILRRLEKKKRN